MATVAKGNLAEVYSPLASSVTITPGSGGTVRFGCSSPNNTPPTPRTIVEAETISIPAGSTMFVEAVGQDATYTEQSTLDALSRVLPASASVSSILLVGDSNTAFFMDQGPTVTGVTENSDGTATITFNASHNFAVGQPVFVSNSITEAVNTFAGTVTAQVNSNPYTITYTTGGRAPVVVSGVAGSTQVQYPYRLAPLGWFSWFQFLQGRRIAHVLAAAGGARAAQALEMYNDALDEALDAKVSDVVVMVGTNDIYADGGSFDTVKASIKALLDRIVSTCPARLWVMTPVPYNSSGGGWSEAKQTVHNRIVRWLWRYSGDIGATCIDTWRCAQQGSTLVDPAAANPDATSGFLSADGVHTSQLGALAIARQLHALAGQTATSQPLMFQGPHADTQGQGNAFTNSRLTGTSGTKTPGSGTISGNAPTSWTVEITSGSGTVTLTNPARTVATDGDADGSNLQVVPSISAVTWRLLQSGLHTAVTAGEVREAAFPVAITGAAGLTGVELIIFGTKSSGGNENIGFAGTSTAITGDFSGVIRAPRWTVPSGLTALSVFLRFTQTGTPAGTFIIGKPALELIE